ncbi:hypothetical protein CAPTEDRAFT_222017 [Capitella teleta]|uniref:DUF4587 domain-containing protein n=1 Tax=Capitella teleta TaxID=283909 RepID=R7U6Y8_CAPTE|nr:hypothetical protein CAPTEDRAFT_222017 [Capitella teleta]|eukprot:ELU01749.1 hypothetical protein CAPTEDRAFT_222017 [Capitella teleta]
MNVPMTSIWQVSRCILGKMSKVNSINRSRSSGDTPRHIIEHQFKPARLDPMTYPPPPPPPAPVAAPATAPAIIQTSQPQPYIINAGGGAPFEMKPTNNKAEMYEMMMMQNAQMHSMIMQQLMISALPKPPRSEQVDVNKKVSVDLDEVISLRGGEKKRPSSVHHHHYGPPTPYTPPQPVAPPAPPMQQTYPYTLPPIQVPPVMPQYYYPSPRPHYPVAEMEPLRLPRVRNKKPKPKDEPKAPPVEEKTVPKRVYGALPFPGPWALRKFRQAGYAVFFSKVLQKDIKKQKYKPRQQMSDSFLFAIKLKEIVAALHFIYLNPQRKVHGMLQQITVDSSRDLSAPTSNLASNSEKDKAIEDLAVILENVVYEMTEIMPATGVLGTHKKAFIYLLTRSGNIFPKGYLWQIEKDILKFDSVGRTTDVGEKEAHILLTGMFIGRALVTTLLFEPLQYGVIINEDTAKRDTKLLLKPVEYGLSSSQITFKAEKNLKMVATLLIYLLRKVYAKDKKVIPPLPHEIGRFLFRDDEMSVAVKKLKNSFEYAESLLQQWSKEYYKRLQV